MDASTSPGLAIGGPTSAAWREEILARAEGLRFLQGWIRAHPETRDVSECADSISRHLDAARVAAGGGPETGRIARRWNRFTRSSFERALANLDMAEIDLLRLSPVVLEGALPSIQAHVNRFLAKDDPRRLELDRLIGEQHEAQRRLTGKQLGARPRLRGNHHEAKPRLSHSERELLLNALFAANTQRRRNLARVRSFRNMLRGGTFMALFLAVALAWIGLAWPQAIPLCFTPETGGTVTVACPQAVQGLGSAALLHERDITGEIARTVRPSDILLVEFVGLLGAVLSVTALLRSVKRGTATPYNVPFLLAVLKVPTGAVTAVAGIILMRADFVPGLSALDSPAQILGWALVFGIAQQLVTRVADDRASTLLEDVGGRGAGGDRPLRNPPQA